MINDPIVEEIRQIRHQMLVKCDGDLEKLLDYYKSLEGRHPERVISVDELRARRTAAPRDSPDKR